MDKNSSNSLKGKIVELEFLDHYQDEGDNQEECVIKCWGLVFDENKNYYCISSWLCDYDSIDSSSVNFYILKKSLIKPVKVLSEYDC